MAHNQSGNLQEWVLAQSPKLQIRLTDTVEGNEEKVWKLNMVNNFCILKKKEKSTQYSKATNINLGGNGPL